jgi:hypothetical protein
MNHLLSRGTETSKQNNNNKKDLHGRSAVEERNIKTKRSSEPPEIRNRRQREDSGLLQNANFCMAAEEAS